MFDLVSSVQFWFGAFVLAVCHIAKFGALLPVYYDAGLASRVPSLRESAFASPYTFFTLAAILVSTFAVYLLLCLVCPTMLLGWATVSGAASGSDLENFAASVPYPLYIAAAFLGLDFGSVQRRLFRTRRTYEKVVVTSSYFANQIFFRSSASNELGRELLRLVSDPWLQRIDAYADVVFYRNQLTHLNLDNDAEIGELLKGSQRELKGLTGQLVYAASLATVRVSGAKSLTRLAADLKVSMPPRPATGHAVLAGGILFLISMTFLWTAIPMFDGLAARFLSAGSKWDFWPDNLAFSGQYLMSQAGPIFLAAGIALVTWSSALRRHEGQPRRRREMASSLSAHLDRYSRLFAAVVVIVVAYDLCQAFFDYGYFKPRTSKVDFWAFVLSNLPFYLMHSSVSLVACFVVLLHLDAIEAGRSKETRFRALALLTAGVGVTSLFYAWGRLYYQYKFAQVDGLDFVVLVVALNLSAAFIAFAVISFCGHGIARASHGSQGRRVLPRGSGAATEVEGQ